MTCIELCRLPKTDRRLFILPWNPQTDSAKSNASRPQSILPFQATPDRAPTRCHNGYAPHDSRHCIFLRHLKKTTRQLPPCIAKRKATSMRFVHPRGPTFDVERAIFPDNKGRIGTRPNQDATIIYNADELDRTGIPYGNLHCICNLHAT